MNKTLRNMIVLILPFFVYWLFLAGLVYLGWHYLTKGITFPILFGFISTDRLACQIPHAVLYFAFGYLASMFIQSDKKHYWILLLCVIGCAMQAITQQHYFSEGVTLIRKIGIVFPQFITPWFAWLAYKIYKQKKISSEQLIIAEDVDANN